MDGISLLYFLNRESALTELTLLVSKSKIWKISYSLVVIISFPSPITFLISSRWTTRKGLEGNPFYLVIQKSLIVFAL